MAKKTDPLAPRTYDRPVSSKRVADIVPEVAHPLHAPLPLSVCYIGFCTLYHAVPDACSFFLPTVCSMPYCNRVHKPVVQTLTRPGTMIISNCCSTIAISHYSGTASRSLPPRPPLQCVIFCVCVIRQSCAAFRVGGAGSFVFVAVAGHECSIAWMPTWLTTGP